MSATQDLFAAVQARTAGTPYVVEPKPEGFDVRLALEDPQWFGSFREWQLTQASVHHVRADEAARTYSVDDELRTLTWRAGTDGRERPVLSAGVSVARGNIRRKSVRRTYALGPGGLTKTSEATFDSSAGRDLVTAAAKELSWKPRLSLNERIGLVVGLTTIVLIVLMGIVVGIVALAGGFS
ncbi:hypothetical protein GCM10022197_16420 [Microlunatus spumicola]|uniref:Uncharacterized protein n=1 Tax=Microlunatus spumicola TaxID=81499 RepID=A0ABP6X4S1_9ACTN